MSAAVPTVCLVCHEEGEEQCESDLMRTCSDALHSVCRSCLDSLVVSAVRASPPQLPLQCPGRYGDKWEQRCPCFVDDALVRSVFPGERQLRELEMAYITAAFARKLSSQLILYTPCCQHAFEIDRRDCNVVPRVLPCPYKCRASMCTGCSRQLSLAELRQVEKTELAQSSDAEHQKHPVVDHVPVADAAQVAETHMVGPTDASAIDEDDQERAGSGILQSSHQATRADVTRDIVTFGFVNDALFQKGEGKTYSFINMPNHNPHLALASRGETPAYEGATVLPPRKLSSSVNNSSSSGSAASSHTTPLPNSADHSRDSVELTPSTSSSSSSSSSARVRQHLFDGSLDPFFAPAGESAGIYAPLSDIAGNTPSTQVERGTSATVLRKEPPPARSTSAALTSMVMVGKRYSGKSTTLSQVGLDTWDATMGDQQSSSTATSSSSSSSSSSTAIPGINRGRKVYRPQRPPSKPPMVEIKDPQTGQVIYRHGQHDSAGSSEDGRDRDSYAWWSERIRCSSDKVSLLSGQRFTSAVVSSTTLPHPSAPNQSSGGSPIISLRDDQTGEARHRMTVMEESSPSESASALSGGASLPDAPVTPMDFAALYPSLMTRVDPASIADVPGDVAPVATSQVQVMTRDSNASISEPIRIGDGSSSLVLRGGVTDVVVHDEYVISEPGSDPSNQSSSQLSATSSLVLRDAGGSITINTGPLTGDDAVIRESQVDDDAPRLNGVLSMPREYRYQSMVSGEYMSMARRSQARWGLTQPDLWQWEGHHVRSSGHTSPHDHLGPLCFRPELHEPHLLNLDTLVDFASFDDKQLQRIFRRTLDEWAPHCPMCGRLGLKSGIECNVITCECGTEWCFMCSKQIFHRVADYLHARRTKPELAAFAMVEQQQQSSSSSSVVNWPRTRTLVPPTWEHASQHLSSTNHHGSFASAPEAHRHDPSAPGKTDTLCPSTLQQLATTYKLPEFVQVCDAFYARHTISSSSSDDAFPVSRTSGALAFSDGIEYRLLQPFLRLRAACGLRTLQGVMPVAVFRRGLDMFPEWASDVSLCAQLGVSVLERPKAAPIVMHHDKSHVRSHSPLERLQDTGDFYAVFPNRQIQVFERNAGTDLDTSVRAPQQAAQIRTPPELEMDDMWSSIPQITGRIQRMNQRCYNNHDGLIDIECHTQSVSAIPPGYRDQVPTVAATVGATSADFRTFWQIKRSALAPWFHPVGRVLNSRSDARVQDHAVGSSKKNVAELHRAMFGNSAPVVSRREMRRKKPKGGRG